MVPSIWRGVVQRLRQLDIVADPTTVRQQSGGSINEAWALQSDQGPLFIKFNDASRLGMFEAEAEGLLELAHVDAIRVPRVVCCDELGGRSYLILEFIELHNANAAAATALGEGLARIHASQAASFGWHRDNTIGTTKQINTPDDDWLSFFIQHRLAYQFSLAKRAGALNLADSWHRLKTRLPEFFRGVTIRPGLLHGDLWGGNWAASGDQPVLFDPAVYYGDPESDIAMTTLFGGFPAAFYEAYRYHRPDESGGHERRELYRLYHVLNHFNLFGGGYGQQAQKIIATLI